MGGRRRPARNYEDFQLHPFVDSCGSGCFNVFGNRRFVANLEAGNAAEHNAASNGTRGCAGRPSRSRRHAGFDAGDGGG
jgi:hypothetical protein